MKPLAHRPFAILLCSSHPRVSQLKSDGGNVGIGPTAPAQALDVVGDVRISGLTASLPVKTNANKDLVSGAINLASSETGTLPVGNGGTGATTLTGILKGNGTSPVTAITGYCWIQHLLVRC